MSRQDFFRRLASDDEIPLTTIPSEGTTPTQSPRTPRQQYAYATETYGKSTSKNLSNVPHFLALVASLILFGVAIAVITPASGLPFGLGSTNQLIAIGVLLALMNFALKPIITFAFLSFEAEFGESRLQNYDGLLRLSPTASDLAYAWRSGLVLLLLLPLVLSALYKRFIGGTGASSMPSQVRSFGLYGPLGLTSDIGLTFMFNATVPFVIAAGNDTTSPDTDVLPKAYGLNIVLLSNASAASLDLPVTDHVRELQLQLQTGTYYDMTADVIGTVTTYIDVTDQASNDSFWASYYRGGAVNPSYAALFPGFLAYFNQGTATDNAYSAFDNSWSFIACTADISDEEFVNSAMLFTTARHNCTGTWRVTRQSFTLQAGSCSSEPLESGYQVLTDIAMALPTYYISSLAEYLGTFCNNRVGCPWRLPTHVVTVSSMYWSRLVSMYGSHDNSEPQQTERPAGDTPNLGLQYDSTELFVLTKPVLKPHWQLYLVLAVQPLVTICALLATMLVYRTPLHRGFGTISILAGMNSHSLRLLGGAGLSGQLDQPLALRIEVVGDEMKYSIDHRTDSSKDRLSRALRYS